MSIINNFWKSIENKPKKLTQLERYENHKSPDDIKKFIEIGGGPKMGTILEQFARFKFNVLNKRNQGGNSETGYDHIIKIGENCIYIEQKSSGHWGEDDYKWQHVEVNHKWHMLLLCGIDYTDIKFWVMPKNTFIDLINKGIIKNQGNKSGDSSEGKWFDYSSVKDYLIPINNDDELLEFVLSLDVAEISKICDSDCENVCENEFIEEVGESSSPQQSQQSQQE
jgi:hypothetical protein